MINAAIHGLILAFGLILPLGVQNVFVFNQGAVQRKWIGVLPVVLTASICDTVLISLAVLGVSAVVLGIPWIKMMLIFVGVVFLIYMGFATWKSNPTTEGGAAQSFTPRKQITFAASVSLLNPHAILDTIGVIGTSSLSYIGLEKITFMSVCIIVSWLWFFGLSIAGRMVGRIDQSGKLILLLNKISALIIWGTACYLIVSLWG